MIPKIAHFHWAGKTMNWLRWASIVTFAKHNPDWEIRLLRTPPYIRKYGLEYAHEADWTWWSVLLKEGGFQVATDIVFTEPVPDEWLDCEISVSVRNGAVWQFAMLGAIPGLGYFSECVSRCEKMAKARLSYQSMGVDLLRRVPLIGYKLFQQPHVALCSVPWDQVDRCWDNELGGMLMTKETIGVHWYGGWKTSTEKEWECGLMDKDYPIVVLAREQL